MVKITRQACSMLRVHSQLCIAHSQQIQSGMNVWIHSVFNRRLLLTPMHVINCVLSSISICIVEYTMVHMTNSFVLGVETIWIKCIACIISNYVGNAKRHPSDIHVCIRIIKSVGPGGSVPR